MAVVLLLLLPSPSRWSDPKYVTYAWRRARSCCTWDYITNSSAYKATSADFLGLLSSSKRPFKKIGVGLGCLLKPAVYVKSGGLATPSSMIILFVWRYAARGWNIFIEYPIWPAWAQACSWTSSVRLPWGRWSALFWLRLSESYKPLVWSVPSGTQVAPFRWRVRFLNSCPVFQPTSRKADYNKHLSSLRRGWIAPFSKYHLRGSTSSLGQQCTSMYTFIK